MDYAIWVTLVGTLLVCMALTRTVLGRLPFSGAMIYLLIFSGLLYASYRKIWKNVGH